MLICRVIFLISNFVIARLQTKIEDLEHLMNDEVTDINEAIKAINNLQVDSKYRRPDGG